MSPQMPASNQNAIELIALTKRYTQGKPAVDSISLRIASGSYCCLLGPSGCGKSTTLRMIAGHESVTSGDILLEDRNITDLPAAARGTAMMFQSFALFPHLHRAWILQHAVGHVVGHHAAAGLGIHQAGSSKHLGLRVNLNDLKRKKIVD